VSFDAITLFVASQQVIIFVFYFVIDSFRKILGTLSYRTIVLSVLLYGCETLSLTLRKEQVAEENIRPKRKEVAGSCRTLHNEALRKL
jgi:hypothetical protein